MCTVDSCKMADLSFRGKMSTVSSRNSIVTGDNYMIKSTIPAPRKSAACIFWPMIAANNQERLQTKIYFSANMSLHSFVKLT